MRDDAGYASFLRRDRTRNELKRSIYISATIAVVGAKRKRSLWSHERSNHHYQHIVMGVWKNDPIHGDKLLQKDIRVDFPTFDLICDAVRIDLTGSRSRFRKPCTVEEKVMMTLDILANGKTYYQAGKNIGRAETTAKKWFFPTLRAIIRRLGPSYIRFPSTKEEVESAVDEWKRRWGLVGCVGAMDGSHIQIEEPFGYDWEFFNFKHYYSVVLHAVVDAHGRFIDVDCRWPGRVGDARIFENSLLRGKILQGDFLRDDVFVGGDIGYTKPFLIGDSAYCLENFVLKAYDNPVTQSHKDFNTCLRAARSTVERTFGRLKERWRIFRSELEYATKDTFSVIAACCVLHNVCEMRNQEIIERADDEETVVLPFDNDPSSNAAAMRMAALKRDYICSLY